MSNELSTTDNVFGTPDAFALAQRQAKMLSSSTMVPLAFQGEGNVGNCVIALEMATRLGASPFMVMQNLDIIHGKPGFSAKFLIGTFNACGRFEAIRYEQDEQDGGRTRAISRELSSKEKIEGPWVSMDMAKVEKWSTKTGSKWITMPELMQRYRAATFMIRTVAPELSLGLHTSEEIRDTEGMRNVTPAPKQEALTTAANPFEKGPKPKTLTGLMSEAGMTEADALAALADFGVCSVETVSIDALTDDQKARAVENWDSITKGGAA